MSAVFSSLNSACVCHLIGVLFRCPAQCISTLKSFSVIEILACTFFTACVYGMNWLAYGWACAW